jgi:NhaA family Na+:H+ antiporter
MSLFVGELAFADKALVAEAKLGILVASVLAALWGALWLHARLPRVTDGAQAASRS